MGTTVAVRSTTFHKSNAPVLPDEELPSDLQNIPLFVDTTEDLKLLLRRLARSCLPEKNTPRSHLYLDAML